MALSSSKIYSFEIKDNSFEILEKKKEKLFNFYKIKFSSELITSYPESNQVFLKLYLPHQSKKNLTAIVHGFGERNAHLIEKYFCKKLASAGVPNFLTSLPYHLERTPYGKRSGEIFAQMDAKESYFFFDQSQKDIRKAFHLISNHFYLGKEFNILGISLGGIVAFICAGLEEKIKRVILLFSGANFNKILWSPLLKRLIKKDCSYEECCKNYAEFMKIYKKIKNLEDILELEKIKPCFLYEPLSFVNFFENKKVLIFSGLFDEVVPYKCASLLHKNLNQSYLIKLPTTHYLGFLFKDFILKKSFNFFK
jgi:hypothetical protein